MARLQKNKPTKLSSNKQSLRDKSLKQSFSSNKHYTKQQKYYDLTYSTTLYDYKLVPWHLTYIDRIKKNVLRGSLKKKTLVDLGAGQGYISIEMAKLGLNVIACDMSKESIKSITRYKKEFKLPNIKTIECFVEKLPLKDNCADYIVANAILEHISNEKEAIAEWKRILKPKGRILLSLPLSYKYIWPFFWPLNYLNDQIVGHLRRYDLKIVKKKFNMKIIDHSYTGHVLKVLWALFSIVFKTNFFGQAIENFDNTMSAKRYGASNIIVVLEKN